MLVMTAGLCYNLKGLTTNYLLHRVNVATSLVHQDQLVFPAVTICNLNPVRKSALEALDGESYSSRKSRKKRASALQYYFHVLANKLFFLFLFYCYLVTSVAPVSNAQGINRWRTSVD